MPHLNIEYSSNLEGKTDIQELCDKLLAAALATGLFEVGAVRVRAQSFNAYAIADKHKDNSFVDMQLRIGKGRTGKEKKAAGEEIFRAAFGHLAKLLESPHFALSFEIREIDSELSWKKNSMHARFRS